MMPVIFLFEFSACLVPFYFPVWNFVLFCFIAFPHAYVSPGLPSVEEPSEDNVDGVELIGVHVTSELNFPK